MLLVFIKGYPKYSRISRNNGFSEFKVEFVKIKVYRLCSRLFIVSYSNSCFDKGSKNVIFPNSAKYRIAKSWGSIVALNSREFTFWTSDMFSIFTVSLYCGAFMWELLIGFCFYQEYIHIRRMRSIVEM